MRYFVTGFFIFAKCFSRPSRLISAVKGGIKGLILIIHFITLWRLKSSPSWTIIQSDDQRIPGIADEKLLFGKIEKMVGLLNQGRKTSVFRVRSHCNGISN